MNHDINKSNIIQLQSLSFMNELFHISVLCLH